MSPLNRVILPHVQNFIRGCIAQLRIALRFAIIAIVAVSRCCHVMIEQPRSSVMRLLEHYKTLGSRLGSQMWGYVNLCGSQGSFDLTINRQSLPCATLMADVLIIAL